MRLSIPRRPSAGVALVAIALAWLLPAGCAASLNVRSYSARGLDVRQYRTYTWGPADAFSTGDPRLDNNRFFQERVRSQIDEQLARKGFEKSPGGQADLLLHYHLNVAQRVEAVSIDPAHKYVIALIAALTCTTPAPVD